MKSLFVAAVLSVLLVGAAPAASPGEASGPGDGFAAGNAAYAAGDFPRAATAYEAQVRRGQYSANLFYNLADAYYRQGDRGRAILNYQRALILDPAHAEAAANLAFVRGGNKAATPVQSSRVAEGLPWFTAAAGWLAVAGLAAGACRRRWRVVGLGAAAVGLLGCIGGIVALRSFDESADNAARAVVVADSAPALYAPADNSKVVTRLTAGGEVRVLSDQGAWVYALLGDGTRAWLAADKIERVVPR